MEGEAKGCSFGGGKGERRDEAGKVEGGGGRAQGVDVEAAKAEWRAW